MNAHQNARTTPLGRATLVRRVLEEGWSARPRRQRSGSVSGPSASGSPAIGEGAWLACTTAARRRRVANRLPDPWVDMIVRLRREYRMTGQEIAERLRLPRSTVAGHLTRLGLGRLAALEPSEPARRYNRARAGELVHFDVKKLARFRRIGHRITGDRHRQNSKVVGSSSTLRSTTPPGSPMSRSCRTRNASRPLAS